MSDDQLTKFLAGVVGVVEANAFERSCLWERHHEKYGKSWVSNNAGLGETIGKIDDMPVHIVLWTAVVDGQKILFVDPTSQVVDHRMIDKWLEENLPLTAFRHGDPRQGFNRTDPTNFTNIFPHKIAA